MEGATETNPKVDPQESIKVKIKCLTAAAREEVPAEVTVLKTDTIYNIKLKLSSHNNIPVEEINLVYLGKVLESAHYVNYYKLADGDTIIYFRKKKKRTADPPAAAEADTPTHTRSQTDTQNPFPMGNGMGNGMGNLGGLDNMRNLVNNPEFMQRMLDSPLTQSLLDNPEMIRSMFQSMPQMQQILENNPHLNHILNDPQLLRQQMEAMRNPAVMQEMLRNQDRAMANIESLPGGYNALRRMYHDVQEPMMEAAEEAAQRRAGMLGEDGSDDSNYVTPGESPNSETLESPWGGSDSNSGSNNTRQSTPDRNPLSALFGAGSGPLLPPMGQGSNGQNGLNLFQNLVPPSNQSNPWASAASSSSNSNPWAENREAEDGSSSQQANQQTQSQNNALNETLRNSILQSLSDPNVLRSMENSNPLLGEMMRNNPHLRTMLSDPNMLNSLSQGFAASSGLAGQNAAASGHSANANPMAGLLASLPTLSPEQRFSRQLDQLEQMGFTDRPSNIQALSATNGNIDAAIDRLLQGSQ